MDYDVRLVVGIDLSVCTYYYYYYYYYYYHHHHHHLYAGYLQLYT